MEQSADSLELESALTSTSRACCKQLGLEAAETYRTPPPLALTCHTDLTKISAEFAS